MQFENELKKWLHKLEMDRERLEKTAPGSEAEFIWSGCVAARARTVVSVAKEHCPELRG